jgi:hypothetical protein
MENMNVRRTLYRVQSFRRVGRQLEPVQRLDCPCATEAEEWGERLAPRAAAVLVYQQEGYPEADVWDDPELLAVHGSVPRSVRTSPSGSR